MELIFKFSQPAYINKLLAKYHLKKTNIVNILIIERALLKPKKDGKVSNSKNEKYQVMTGLLIFPMIETRPDIVFATLIVSQFAKNLSHQHTKTIKTILYYIK